MDMKVDMKMDMEMDTRWIWLETPKQTGKRLPEEELRRRIDRFKGLVKQGKLIWESLKESRLHPRGYNQYYDEIWGSPDMAEFTVFSLCLEGLIYLSG